VTTQFDSAEASRQAAANCPVEAIIPEGYFAQVELRRGIHCQRCHFGGSSALTWQSDYEWTQVAADQDKYEEMASACRGSLHVMVVDAGDCGDCLHEVKLLNNPFITCIVWASFSRPLRALRMCCWWWGLSAKIWACHCSRRTKQCRLPNG
jgi:hypothetical protein